jgi:hypothetical protein
MDTAFLLAAIEQHRAAEADRLQRIAHARALTLAERTTRLRRTGALSWLRTAVIATLHSPAAAVRRGGSDVRRSA